MRKKKILWHSNFSLSGTGFGTYTKHILSYLHKTGKYIIANYASGIPKVGFNESSRFPWSTRGTIPNDRPDIIQRANADPGGFGRSEWFCHCIRS